MDTSIDVEVLASMTPLSQKRKNSEREDDSPEKNVKKLCDPEDHQELLAQVAILTSSFLDFKTTILTKLTSIEEDLQLVKSNTLLNAEPIDNEQKLNSLTQSVEEIKECLKRGQINERSDNNGEVQHTQRPASRVFSRHQELNKRKMSYYNHLQHEDKYNILEAQAADEPPGVPAKFLPIRILNEPPEDLEARKELCKAKIHCELTRLKNGAHRFKKQYEEIDEKVLTDIDNSTMSEEEKSIQKEEWRKKTAEEETISNNLWKIKHDKICKAPFDAMETGRIYLYEGVKFATSTSTKQGASSRSDGQDSNNESNANNQQGTDNNNFLWQRPRTRNRRWNNRRWFNNRTGRRDY